MTTLWRIATTGHPFDARAGELLAVQTPLPGARHVSRTDGGRDGTVLVTADADADAADTALETLSRLRVPAEDIALVRLDRIAALSPETEPTALM